MKSSQGFAWSKVENHLPQAGQELTDALNAVVTKTVLDIQGDAVGQAPVGRTGLLKSSIQAIRPDAWGDEIMGGVGSNVEYATYVELGTGARGAASPYPFRTDARYTPSWPGMRARAMIANAAKRAEPGYVAAMDQVGRMMPRKV
jgi:hypothetical protein